MSIDRLSAALYQTHVSGLIRDTGWIIPTVQSIHILAIAVVIGSAIVMDLRFAGVLAVDESPRTVVRRYLPWLWIALSILLATGVVMIIGEPDRTLQNWVFWSKMALVLSATVLTLLFRWPILRREVAEEHHTLSAMAKPLAWLSLVVWILVIFCGRWIAYV